jgi:hypothetical protein
MINGRDLGETEKIKANEKIRPVFDAPMLR